MTRSTRPAVERSRGALITGLIAGVVSAMLAVPAPAGAGTPTYDGFGDGQELDVQASPPMAGAGIVFDFQQSYWNALGLAALRSPVGVVIHFPRGVGWNGTDFPQCDPAQLSARGPAACPPGSEFATGDAIAAVALQGVTIRAHLTDFVGPLLHGSPTQVLYVTPQVGPPFVLTGVIREEPTGPYGLAEHIDLRPLPGATPLTPSPVVIVSLHNVDIHTSVKRTIGGRVVETPLIVAPAVCEGFWQYAFDSVYQAGPPLTSTTRQPCVPARGSDADPRTSRHARWSRHHHRHDRR